MSGYRRWRDTEQLSRAVRTAGGKDAFQHEVQRQRDEARGWRLGGTLTLVANFGDEQLKVG